MTPNCANLTRKTYLLKDVMFLIVGSINRNFRVLLELCSLTDGYSFFLDFFFLVYLSNIFTYYISHPHSGTEDTWGRGHRVHSVQTSLIIVEKFPRICIKLFPSVTVEILAMTRLSVVICSNFGADTHPDLGDIWVILRKR